MTLSDLVSDIVRKLKGEPPAYVPPARFYSPPRPMPVPTAAAATQADLGPTATLVSTREHTQGIGRQQIGSGVGPMTTDLFFKKAKQLLAPRPTPVNLQMSSTTGIQPVSVAAPIPVAPYPTPVSLEKKPADLETISLGPKATFISTPQIDAHGTDEEKVGPRRKPASLVGGL